MGCYVNLSSPLWKYTQNQAEFEMDGKNIKEILCQLEKEAPGLASIFSGPLIRAIKIYINNEDIDMLNGTDTMVKDGDEVYLSPVLTGG